MLDKESFLFRSNYSWISVHYEIIYDDKINKYVLITI